MRTYYNGSSKRRILLIVVLFLLTVAAAATVLRAKKGLEKVMVPNRPLESVEDLTIGDHFRRQTPINILLLGYAGANHEGTFLTDSMIVIHLDLKENKAGLVSLPRDIWVNLPLGGAEGSFWKINAAYAIGNDDKKYPGKPAAFTGEGGGGALSKFAVEKITGLSIDRFVAVDFSGFEKAIDLLGGVDVNVEKTFVDPEYPISGRETDLCGRTPEELPKLLEIATISAVQAFPCRFESLRFDAGINRLDGTTALKFVRSRHSFQDGSDFARASRQRNLLTAVKEKVVSLNFVSKALPTLEILKDNFRTDFSVEDIKSFLSRANELNGFSIRNIALTTDNVLSNGRSTDGQYILLPNSLETNDWSPIHRWLSERLSQSPNLTTPIVKIENGTKISGLADLATNRLRKQGFIVWPPSPADKRNYSKTTLATKSAVARATLAEISKEIGLTAPTNLAADSLPYDIRVVLGQDYFQLTQERK